MEYVSQMGGVHIVSYYLLVASFFLTGLSYERNRLWKNYVGCYGEDYLAEVLYTA